MKKLLFCLIAFSNLYLIAQSSHYQIDLTKIHKDDLKIRFNCDELKTEEAVFYFPKTVPGTYAVLDYGRYVKKLKAYTKEGKILTVKKEGENAFRIYNAKALDHIDYQLQDTWEQAKGNMIFEPAGTGFEAGKYFVLNNGGVFGTIHGYENYPFYIDITTTKGLEGYSSMIKSNTGDVQHFKAKHYHQLIDEPIMFTNQQVETIQVNNCKVTIASYQSNATEIITDRENGFIIDPTNITESKEKIKEILKLNENEINKVKKNAKILGERFTDKHLTKKYYKHLFDPLI